MQIRVKRLPFYAVLYILCLRKQRCSWILPINLPNRDQFSEFFRCYQNGRNSQQNIYTKFSPLLKCVDALPCDMTFHTRSISLTLSHNLSKVYFLTCIQAHRCVYHSLIVMLGDFLSFNKTALSRTASPQHMSGFWSRKHKPQFISPEQKALTSTQWTK